MKSFKSFILEKWPGGIDHWMSDKTKSKAAMKKQADTMNTPLTGNHYVRNKINITFHKDRIEFHKGGDLIHTKHGDYKNPTKKHLSTATSITSKLYSNKK